MAESIQVEVVFALPDRQCLVEVALDAGATIADAIDASGLRDLFLEQDIAALPAGIWGRELGRDEIVSDGDRVEIYRSLEIDPREARRRLASSGQTMGRSAHD